MAMPAINRMQFRCSSCNAASAGDALMQQVTAAAGYAVQPAAPIRSRYAAHPSKRSPKSRRLLAAPSSEQERSKYQDIATQMMAPNSAHCWAWRAIRVHRPAPAVRRLPQGYQAMPACADTSATAPTNLPPPLLTTPAIRRLLYRLRLHCAHSPSAAASAARAWRRSSHPRGRH